MSAGVRDVLRLAWPSALSYLLNNAYRINDQYWVQGLGGEAQAALAAILFVGTMNFSLIMLASVGTLAYVARATGAGDRRLRDQALAQALWIAAGVYALLALAGPPLVPHIVAALGLSSESAEFAELYLHTLYLTSLPLVLAPTIDHAFIGIGNTLIPSMLELFAVAINYLLAPVMIYGSHAAERVDLFGADAAAAIGSVLGFEGFGIAGAPLAICCSRALSTGLGLAALRRYWGFHWLAVWRPQGRLIGAMIATSLPAALSIALYSVVYWVLIKWVLVALGDPVLAGLGLGFSVFEGVSFPCFLGVAMAGAGLVGRAIGACDPEAALRAERSARRIALVLGFVAAAAFLALARIIAPHFSRDPVVVRETIGYVMTIAFSQVFVAQEATNERILFGAGYTRWAMWISLFGNGLRVPLGYLFGIAWGFGAPGVWWALNATSVLKAALQFRLVQRKTWLASGLERAACPPRTTA